MKTNLSGVIEYQYTPFEDKSEKATDIPTFMGYIRDNGAVIYKGEHGYRSYSLGGGYDTYEGEDNYLMWKDYWLERYSKA